MWRLRIYQDDRYPRLVEACAAAIEEATGRRAGITKRIGCQEISCYWKHRPCVFPQAGPGKKHLRRIQLEAWQWRLVEDHPRELVRGLIHSDGCRVINRVRSAAGKWYAYPRYHFSNRSADIKEIFMRACALIGVECRSNNRYNISVAKRRSVAILDEFIGPKS